jgi:hypothetical protein
MATATDEKQGAQAAPAPEETSGNFGVYQLETGSYQAGENVFTPLEVVSVNAKTAKALGDDSPDAPVRFFKTLESAGKEVERLRTAFLRKRVPPPGA